ncbi:MAG: hypothetical protein V3U02_11035, partial [Calditrichia bacterium]
RSADAILEANVLDIASKFTCSCGSCGEEALETCSCNTAIQEREYIRRQLQKGKSASAAIAAVNAKYGHMKPEYAGKNSNSDLNLNLAKKLKSFELSSQTNLTGKNNNLANFQDREEIYSHFQCPCGQCAIPELTDCECSHPGGAKEVKTFIDNQIQEGKYSKAQLIELVENRYGHKIR